MTNRRSGLIKVSQKKAEELLNIFQIATKDAMSAHLSDDQFVGYITGDLSEGKMLEIDRHLEVCEDCGAQIERLAVNAMAWSKSNGMHRVKQLRKQALDPVREQQISIPSFLDDLAIQIRSLLLGTNLRAGVVSAATEEKKHFQHGDQWSCYLDIDGRGNYTLRISSHDVSLEGTQLRLLSKNWQREITLIRVDPNQVGAKVVLSPEDLAKIPQGQDFSVELIRQSREAE